MKCAMTKSECNELLAQVAKRAERAQILVVNINTHKMG